MREMNEDLSEYKAEIKDGYLWGRGANDILLLNPTVALPCRNYLTI
jgi:hypothetical protein